MDEDEYQAAFAGLVSDAQRYAEETVGPERIAAMKLFNTENYGNEVEGRSKAHSSDARDAVLSKLPSLLRVFTGAQTPVEVIPRDETEVLAAQDQTATIDYFVFTKNNGFKLIHDAIFDAETKKVGVLHWYKADRERWVPATYKGFSQEMIDLLEGQDDIEIISQEEEDNDDAPTSEQANPLIKSQADPSMMKAALAGLSDDESQEQDLGDLLKTYTVFVRRKVKDLDIKIECIPPEEFLIDRAAKDEHSARIIGRRREMTLGELVSLGYDEDEIVEHWSGGASGMTSFDIEAATRVQALLQPDHDAKDPANRTVPYYEMFHRTDKDGLGGPLRRTCAVGEGFHIIWDEMYPEDEIPFAILCGNPIPHAAIGNSTIDLVADIQMVKTSILRNTLDSLANSIFPRTAFDATKVNVDDLFNSEPGALVRCSTAPGNALMELNSTFIGQQALQVMSYFDDVKQKRLGTGDGTSLSGDELQSTTAVAAAAIVGQGQDRLELECRHYAEALARAFSGLLRLVIRHYDRPLPIRTRDGTFRNVDPRTWDPTAEVRCSVGMGKHAEAQRVQMLSQMLSIQTQLLSSAGLGQPLVGPTEVRNVIEDLALSFGSPSVARWFKKPDPNWQPPQQPRQMDPMFLQAQATALQAQVAQKKAEGEHLIALEKARNDATQAAAQMAQDRYLKEIELQFKYGAQFSQSQIDQQIESERLRRDQEVASALGMADLAHRASEAQLDREHDIMNQSLSLQPTGPQGPAGVPGQQKGPQGPQQAPQQPQAPQSAPPAQPGPQTPPHP